MVDPNKRYSLQEIKSHPWFQSEKEVDHYFIYQPKHDTTSINYVCDEDDEQKVDELSKLLKKYAMNKYESSLRKQGLEYEMIKGLEEDRIKELATKANMNLLHKKIFCKVIKLVKSGEYPPKSVKNDDEEKIDALSEWIRKYGFSKYESSLKESIIEYEMIKGLEEDRIEDITTKAKMNKLHKKVFAKAIEKVKTGKTVYVGTGDENGFNKSSLLPEYESEWRRGYNIFDFDDTFTNMKEKKQLDVSERKEELDTAKIEKALQYDDGDSDNTHRFHFLGYTCSYKDRYFSFIYLLF